MVSSLCALAVCLAAAPVRPFVVAYVPNWNDLAAFTETIDFSKLTHIDVAFENPTDDVGDLSFNEIEKGLIAKAHANHVKILVSIGGGAASGDKVLVKRYFDLQTDAKRADFISRLSAYVTAHQFDGLDLDLEGPSVGPDYGAFVADLSKELLPKGLLLTAAVSQGYGGDKIPDSVFDKFSFLNVMAYDGSGPWQPNRPGPHSSMEYTKGNLQYWLGRGLPKSKAVLGVPFYGYGFGKAFRQGDYSFLGDRQQVPRLGECGSDRRDDLLQRHPHHQGQGAIHPRPRPRRRDDLVA